MSDLMKVFGIWAVRIVRQGEMYGRNDCIRYEEEKELVEFYDTRYRNDKEWKRGQFVSSYYLETVLEDAEGTCRVGLSLDGGIPAWTVKPKDMVKIIAWLRKYNSQQKEHTMKTVSPQLVKVISAHARIHNDYSGRCMFGEKCFGFSTGYPETVVGAVLEEINNMPEPEKIRNEFTEMLQHCRQDSMGLGSILYFPGYQTAETEK